MENKQLKILFIPNWNIIHLTNDIPTIQAPDKYIKGQSYWFFKYFPKGTHVDIIDIGKKSWFQFLEKKLHIYLLQPFKAFLKRNNYDIVISHGAQSGLFYELLVSFCKKKPTHLMFDIGGLNSSRINYIEIPILRFILRKCPNIIVHSSRQINFYNKYYPQQARNVKFIPFGTDVSYFNSFSSNKNINKTIISFGKIKRDYKTLCQAFCQIKNTDFKLHIIGDTKLAKEFSSVKNIIFEDAIPLNELIERINKCSFVVVPLPEYMYSYGQMTILQSMALKKPLIVSETTSTIDYISEATGIIKIKPYDIDDMRNALTTMINTNKQTLINMGNENSSYVKEKLNEKEMGQNIYNIITQILK